MSWIRKERWRWVKGYEGMYMVSDEGRVMSVPRNTASGLYCGTVLAQRPYRSGRYKAVTLSRNSERRCFSVHRLVAEAFIPNPEGKSQVNHKDGNKNNNVLSNLEWVTASENVLHSYRFLPRKSFSHFHPKKLTWQQVKEIRESKGTACSVAKRYGISDVMVLKIRKGECWKEEQCL